MEMTEYTMSSPAQFMTKFLAEIQEPHTATISPTRFATKLDLEQQQLAVLARVHRNTVTRKPVSPVLQEYLRDAVRVIAAAANLSGDSQRVLYWFRNQPISAFGYQTPDQIVSDGKANKLIRYVESLEAGGAG